jgi:transposase
MAAMAAFTTQAPRTRAINAVRERVKMDYLRRESDHLPPSQISASMLFHRVTEYYALAYPSRLDETIRAHWFL